MPIHDAVFEIQSIEAIKRLKARYFRYIDTKQWAELRRLFTDDATFLDYVIPGKDPTADEFVARIAQFCSTANSVHQGFMPEIDITGPTSATATWMMQDILDWPLDSFTFGDHPVPGQRGMIGHGRYDDSYALVDGQWLVCATRLTRYRVEALRGDPGLLMPRLMR